MGAADEIRFGTDGWRAVIADDFTYENLRRVADAAGRVFSEDAPGGRIIVGHDTRFEAPAFARAAAEVLAGSRARGGRHRPLSAHAGALLVGRAGRGGGRRRHAHGEPQSLALPGLQAPHGRWRSVAGLLHRPRRGGAPRGQPPTFAGSSRSQTSSARTSRRCAGWWMRRPSARQGSRWPSTRSTARGRATWPRRCARSGVEVTEIHDVMNPGFRRAASRAHPAAHRRGPRAREGAEGSTPDSSPTATPTASEPRMRRGDFVNPHRIICLVAQHLVEDKGMSGKVVKTLSTSVLVDRLCDRLGLECVTTPGGLQVDLRGDGRWRRARSAARSRAASASRATCASATDCSWRCCSPR